MELAGPLLEGAGHLELGGRSVVSAEGSMVRFSDHIEAFSASAGLWHANLGHGTPTPTVSTPTSSEERSDQLFNKAGLDDLIFVESAAAGMKLVTDHVRAVETIGSATTSSTDRAVGILSPADRASTGYRPSWSGAEHVVDIGVDRIDRRELSALIVITTAAYGTQLLPRSVVDAAIGSLPPTRVMLIADETMSGCFRTGEAFAAERWSRQPDVVLLGPAIANGETDLYALATSKSIGRRIRALARSSIVPTLGVERAIRCTAAHMSMLRRDRRPSQTADLLARGLQAMRANGLLTEVVGQGLAYLLSPTPEIRSTGAEVVVEMLRREQVWVAADPDARLVLLPPVNSSAGDIARLLDGLNTALMKLHGL